MVGKGAPAGNKYAKKETIGRSISVYITGEEWEILRTLLLKKGQEPTQESMTRLAKNLLKESLSECARELRKGQDT